MGTNRIAPTLLLVVLSAAGGAIAVDLLREPTPAPEAEVLREQTEVIERLRVEVRRLRSEQARAEAPASAEAQEPPAVLAGRPNARPPFDRPEAALADVPPPPAAATAPARLQVATRPGGMLDLVRHLAATDARQTTTELVEDPERVATLFAPRAEGPTVRAEETTPAAEVADGTTIVLDAGVYDFSAFSSAHRGAFPGDVTFRGVGRDRTLLVLHELGATGETRNLGFEDLTLDTRGHYLADVRGDEPISLRFERARVIGFDQSPGGAVLLAARHGAFLARDTRIEAGFGNAPGTGSLFHVRGPFLVRFERCTFLGPFQSLYEKSEQAAYAFVRCSFEQQAPESRRDLESPEGNLRVEDCVFEYRPTDAAEPKPRARTELNPAWR